MGNINEDDFKKLDGIRLETMVAYFVKEKVIDRVGELVDKCRTQQEVSAQHKDCLLGGPVPTFAQALKSIVDK